MIVTDREGLLILVADGARARLVRCAADNALHTVQDFESTHAHQRSADLGTDKPGASLHSFSTAHHAIAPRHDPQRMEKDKFAAQAAAAVNDLCAREGITGVILVAPAHTLPVLQDHLTKTAAALVIGTLGKELVKVPDHELQPHLAEWVAPIYRPHSHI